MIPTLVGLSAEVVLEEIQIVLGYYFGIEVCEVGLALGEQLRAEVFVG